MSLCILHLSTTGPAWVNSMVFKEPDAMAPRLNWLLRDLEKILCTSRSSLENVTVDPTSTTECWGLNCKLLWCMVSVWGFWLVTLNLLLVSKNISVLGPGLRPLILILPFTVVVFLTFLDPSSILWSEPEPSIFLSALTFSSAGGMSTFVCCTVSGAFGVSFLIGFSAAES